MLLRAFGGASFSSLTVIVLLLVLNLRATVHAEENFCPKNASVDLTNATRNATGFFAESGHFFPIEIVRNGEDGLRGCMCDLEPCVSLCPPLSDKLRKWVPAKAFKINLTEISMFRLTSSTSEDVGNLSFKAEEWFHFFTWDACMDNNYHELYQADCRIRKWHLFENGSLLIPLQDDAKILLDWREYCLWKELNHTTYILRICFGSSSDLFGMMLFIGLLISVPLMIATIFVYSFLPQLKNIHGKTLSRYLGCLLVMNIFRVIELMYPTFRNSKVLCLIFDFIIDFLGLSSFLWLNVMCFDMWWRFGGYGSIRNRGRIEDREKIIGYSIFAWGTTVVMNATCFGLEFIPGVSLLGNTPSSGTRSCWCDTWYAMSIDLALVFLSITCNICLFVLISIKLIQHRMNSRRQLSSGDSKRHDDNQPQLLSVNLKLFVIMGISWSTIYIDTFWNPPIYVQYFTALFSDLQGIPIFIVLVCKKKIWQSLKMRFKW